MLLTCCSNRRRAILEKSSKKGVNRKGKCFLSSQTRWSWQNKRACTSFWTQSPPGHWSHTREPSSSHAAASTFKVLARKRSLLTLCKMCVFGQIKMEIPWYINRHTLIYRKRDGKPRMIGVGVHQLSGFLNTSHPMLQIRSKLLHGDSTPSSLNSSYI